MKEEIIKQFREKLANIEHQRWSDWQKYVHEKCVATIKGLLIPTELAEGWQRQFNTSYNDLTEKEKDSDREQVDRYWYLIEELLAQVRQETEERARESGILEYLLNEHIKSGEYWGDKEKHYKTCKKLFNLLTKKV